MRSFHRALSGLAAAVPLIALGASAQPDNELSAEEQAAGWQLLFDGESLEHWRSYGKPDVDPRWQIRDGAIVLDKRGGGDLITRQAWRNFELQLEWQIAEGGNSGIFFLADESSKPIFVHAPEVQILDNERHRDNKRANRRSGSLYDLVAAPPASQKPAGEWNRVTIVHVDGHLVVRQNGVETVNIHIGGERWNELVADSKFADWPGFGEVTSGHIGLQDHGDRVAFRNLKIRTRPELP